LDLDLGWLKKYSKPIFFTLKEDIEILREIRLKIEKFFPVYTTPERAVRALKNALTFTKNPQLSLLFKGGSE
jgi:acyl-CoA synthetase (NDP forming)